MISFLPVEFDDLFDVRVDAVRHRAGLCGVFDEFLLLVGVVASLGEPDLEVQFGDPARVCGHYLFGGYGRPFYRETVGAGGHAHYGQHAAAQRSCEKIGGGEKGAVAVVVLGCDGADCAA